MRFEEGKIRRIAPGVFLRPAVDNSLWADLGDGVVVVDGLEDQGLASVIQDAVAQTTGKPLRWVVATHWHGDHTACNPAWAAAGATVIAHEAAARATAAHDGQPDIVFQERHSLRGADREVQLEWLGGTHTREDTAVYFPWAGVLHVGDLFGWGLIPLRSISEETAARLRAVCSRLLSYDAQEIVPGHGPTLSTDHLRRFVDYFEDLFARVPALCRAGMPLAEIERAVPPPADMLDWWRLQDWKHARNLERLCRWAER